MLVVDLDNLTVQDVTKIIDEKNVQPLSNPYELQHETKAAELSLWVRSCSMKTSIETCLVAQRGQDFEEKR
eukprot:UN08232